MHRKDTSTLSLTQICTSKQLAIYPTTKFCEQQHDCYNFSPIVTGTKYYCIGLFYSQILLPAQKAIVGFQHFQLPGLPTVFQRRIWDLGTENTNQLAHCKILSGKPENIMQKIN